MRHNSILLNRRESRAIWKYPESRSENVLSISAREFEHLGNWLTVMNASVWTTKVNAPVLMLYKINVLKSDFVLDRGITIFLSVRNTSKICRFTLISHHDVWDRGSCIPIMYDWHWSPIEFSKINFYLRSCLN